MWNVSVAGHLAAFAGTCAYADRVDAGAWGNASALILPTMFLGICAVDDAAGGSGGGLRLAGHGGLAA